MFLSHKNVLFLWHCVGYAEVIRQCVCVVAVNKTGTDFFLVTITAQQSSNSQTGLNTF